MEHVVRTITFANEGHADRAISQAVKARAWESLTRPGDVGRFVPDTEVTAQDAAVQKRQQATTYEAFLRAETESVDTEVNMQLGE